MTNNHATFAAGCFWGVQYYFDQVPGVTRTTVGYTGGHAANPTYEQVCAHNTGHAEAVLLEFNPAAVLAGESNRELMQGAAEERTGPYARYGEGSPEAATQQTVSFGNLSGSADLAAEAFRLLMKHFFRMHDPTQFNRQGPDIGDQYRSAIFYENEVQRDIAQKIRDESQSKFEQPIVTQIVPAAEFHEAEAYHQKFAERTGRGMCHVPYAAIS